MLMKMLPTRLKSALSHMLRAGLMLGALAVPAQAKEILARLDTGIANVYLLKGPQPILIDTSAPGYQLDIEDWLRSQGVEPSKLAMIILTHGHGDHAGNAAYFAKKYHVPVLVGRGDYRMIRTGAAAEVHPTSFLAGLLALFVPPPFAPFEPSQVIDQELNLKAYGFNARVVPLSGGHTQGSLAVILDDTHEALVGDLVRGSMFVPGFAEEHFFQDNRWIARWQLWELLRYQNVETFWPGHFEPFSSDEVLIKFFPDGHFAWP